MHTYLPHKLYVIIIIQDNYKVSFVGGVLVKNLPPAKIHILCLLSNCSKLKLKWYAACSSYGSTLYDTGPLTYYYQLVT